MPISRDQANRIIGKAIARADEFGIRISVSVCDAGGRLFAFQRMDGAHWAGGYGSQGKAVTAAGFARPSGVVAELADLPIMRGIAEAEGGHIIYCQGALPIIISGELIGACGVGGGSAQQDEDCARAGIEGL